jgi:hypothetical protein
MNSNVIKSWEDMQSWTHENVNHTCNVKQKAMKRAYSRKVIMGH